MKNSYMKPDKTKENILELHRMKGDVGYVLVAMQEYADQEKRKDAVAFTNWQAGADCEYSMTDEDQWTHNHTLENITTEQLYNLFVQQTTLRDIAPKHDSNRSGDGHYPGLPFHP